MSARITLLLVCLAVALHSIYACDTIKKGKFYDVEPEYVTSHLEMGVMFRAILLNEVISSLGSVAISGVEVEVCSDERPADVKLTYYNGYLFVKRNGSNFDSVYLRIKFTIVPGGTAISYEELENGDLN